MKIGYIYLIREREFLYRNESVYKVGKGEQEPDHKIKRLTNYKRGSEIVFAWQVESVAVHKTEAAVTKALGARFQHHSDGNEYFVGDPKKMRLTIVEVLIKLEKDTDTAEDVESSTEIVDVEATGGSTLYRQLGPIIRKEYDITKNMNDQVPVKPFCHYLLAEGIRSPDVMVDKILQEFGLAKRQMGGRDYVVGVRALQDDVQGVIVKKANELTSKKGKTKLSRRDFLEHLRNQGVKGTDDCILRVLTTLGIQFKQDDDPLDLFEVTTNPNDFVTTGAVLRAFQAKEINLSLKKFAQLIRNKGAVLDKKSVEGEETRGYSYLKLKAG